MLLLARTSCCNGMVHKRVSNNRLSQATSRANAMRGATLKGLDTPANGVKAPESALLVPKCWMRYVPGAAVSGTLHSTRAMDSSETTKGRRQSKRVCGSASVATLSLEVIQQACDMHGCSSKCNMYVQCTHHSPDIVLATRLAIAQEYHCASNLPRPSPRCRHRAAPLPKTCHCGARRCEAMRSETPRVPRLRHAPCHARHPASRLQKHALWTGLCTLPMQPFFGSMQHVLGCRRTWWRCVHDDWCEQGPLPVQEVWRGGPGVDRVPLEHRRSHGTKLLHRMVPCHSHHITAVMLGTSM